MRSARLDYILNHARRRTLIQAFRAMNDCPILLTCAVGDMEVSRRFYEEILGFELAQEVGGEWLEYQVGETTHAIHPTSADRSETFAEQALLAVEVSNLNAEMVRLRKCGAAVRSEIIERREYRLAIVLDPDGREIVICERKRSR